MKRSETELAVIGLALRGEDQLHDLLSAGVSSGHFSDPKGRAVWQSLELALRAREPTDLTSIASRLGFGEWPAYLIAATEAAPLSQSVRFYAGELKRQAWTEALGSLAMDVQKLAHSRTWGDPGKAIVEAVQRLSDHAQDQGSGLPEPKSAAAALDEAITGIEEAVAANNHNRMVGIPTGFGKLDKFTRGFRPGAFYVLAARPGRGKTTLALNFADAALAAGKSVLFFTVEMTAGQLMTKLLSKRSKVDSYKLDKGDLSEAEEDRIHYAAKQIHDQPFFIDDSFGASLPLLTATVEKFKRRGGCDLVVIDYVQQLQLPGEKHPSRQAELTKITHAIKQMALKLKLPVIGLAQVSRQGEAAEMPSLRHLKDSGSLEQDADAVLFIYEDSNHDTALVLLKNRFGPAPDDFVVEFNAGISTFSEV